MALFIKTATPSSQIRLCYAQEIAAACPESLFAEIALTGSSARGIANESSDIEINFWLERIPTIEARKNWLIELGLENLVAHSQARSDGSIWLNGTYKGIELEAGWQTFADLETSLTELIEASTTDHKKLRLAELLLSAKSLRGSGVLNYWQPILQNYPETLADKLIADALSTWLNDNDWLETRLESNDFTSDLANIYRILFALNHRWEINWKWAHHFLDEFKIIPSKLLKNEVENEAIQTQILFTQAALKSHLRLRGGDLEEGLELILETLALIEPSFPNRDKAINKFQIVGAQR